MSNKSAAFPVVAAAHTLRALSDLRPGDTGRLHDADLIDQDRHLLEALGFVPQSRFRVCQAGDPWIVQVLGTRIGLADSVAHRLQVVEES